MEIRRVIFMTFVTRHTLPMRNKLLLELRISHSTATKMTD